MSYNQRQPHGGPAGPPPNNAPDFNAMLQRSQLEPGRQEHGIEAPGRPSSSIGRQSAGQHHRRDNTDKRKGYGGVYSATPPPQHGPNVLGGARGPPPQQILPLDLPPQAFLTSSMLLDMVDSMLLRLYTGWAHLANPPQRKSTSSSATRKST